MTESGTCGSVGKRLLVTALLPVGCVAAFVVALRLLLAWPAVPGCVGDLLGSRGGGLSGAGPAVLMLWIGFAPAWVGLAMLRRPAWGLGLPAWAGLIGATSLAMFRQFVTDGPWAPSWDEQSVRLLVLLSYLGVILILANAAVGAAGRLCWDAALQCIFLLLVMGLPWIVLAHVALSGWQLGEGPTGLVRSGPLPGHVFLVLLAFLVAVNGAALGHALGRLRIWSLLAWLPATAVLTAPGWLLLRLGLSPEVVEGGATYPAVHLLLAPDPHASVASTDLFLRWSAVQGGLVLALALGHLCAARFTRQAPEARADTDGADLAAKPARTAAGKTKPAARPGRAYLVVTGVYGLLVIYGSLVPLDYRPRPFEGALETFLQTPYFVLGIRSRADLVANVLLFIPLTFAAMGAMTRENTRTSRWLTAAVVAAGAVVLSVGVEFVQLYFPPRTVSLNDILAECVGGAVGIGAWLLAGDRVTAWWRRLGSAAGSRSWARHLLAGYVVALVLYQLLPFDLVMSADEMALKLEQGKLVLVPFAEPHRTSRLLLVGKAVALVPVGYWIVVRRRGVRRPVWAALGGGVVFAACVEVLQVFIFSRYTRATDVVVGGLGAGTGGLLACHFGPAARRSLSGGVLGALLSWGLRLGATAAVAAALVWGKWSPFAFQWPEGGLAGALAQSAQVPFFYQYWNPEFEAFAQMLRDVAVPAVLGVLVMSVFAPARGVRRLMAGLVAGSVSAGAELGQMFFPPHIPDMTTAVLAAAAGVVGTYLYRPFVEAFVRPGRSQAHGRTAGGT